MTQQIEVKKDLLKVMLVMLLISGVLVGIKLYDTKTNEVGKIGEYLLSKYVN